MSKHVCRHWDSHRGQRYCKFCNKRQWQVGNEWQNEMSLEHFANNWLPAISGTNPKKMMVVEVAFPFEWNCYESWNTVFRVRFEFPEHHERLTTRAHVMDGWESRWQECFNRIDAEARTYYEEATGGKYDIGDNTYEEMRRIIQS